MIKGVLSMKKSVNFIVKKGSLFYYKECNFSTLKGKKIVIKAVIYLINKGMSHIKIAVKNK